VLRVILGDHRAQSNLYEMLQVSASADPTVIHAAYRTLARSYHPDVNSSGDAAIRMRELNAAYHVLSDPDRRARYDAHLRSRARTCSTHREPRNAYTARRIAPVLPKSRSDRAVASRRSLRTFWALVFITSLLFTILCTMWALYDALG
jgi:curved DNA-binding protein CbpA